MLRTIHWRHKSKTRRAGWAGFWTLAFGGMAGLAGVWPSLSEAVSLPVFVSGGVLLGIATAAGAHLFQVGGDQ